MSQAAERDEDKIRAGIAKAEYVKKGSCNKLCSSASDILLKVLSRQRSKHCETCVFISEARDAWLDFMLRCLLFSLLLASERRLAP